MKDVTVSGKNSTPATTANNNSSSPPPLEPAPGQDGKVHIVCTVLEVA